MTRRHEELEWPASDNLEQAVMSWNRHCEERSDAAIQWAAETRWMSRFGPPRRPKPCRGHGDLLIFAALAMTKVAQSKRSTLLDGPAQGARLKLEGPDDDGCVWIRSAGGRHLGFSRHGPPGSFGVALSPPPRLGRFRRVF
jgi:hypothetical protein